MKRKLIELETERLWMRPITLEDVEDMYILNLDPEVVQYTGDKAFKSIDETKQFYSAYNQYEKFGMGRFSTFLKSSNEFIGWCGLKKIEKGEIDLGYRFSKRYWGNGYATESSLASLKYGFNNLNLEEIIAQAWVINPASVRVMKKVGMTFKKDFFYAGKAAVQYNINVEGFRERYSEMRQ